MMKINPLSAVLRVGWVAVATLALAPHSTRAQAPTEPVKSHLQLWMKADAGVTKNAGGGVTAWADQSGKGNHAAQSDATMTPQWVDAACNGKPVLRFDGDNDYLDVPNAPSIQIAGDISSFVVAKFDDFDNYREVWGKTVGNLPGANDWYLMQNTGVSRVYRGAGTSSGIAYADSSAGVNPGEYVVLGFTMTGATMVQSLNADPFGGGNIAPTLEDGSTPLKIGTREDFACKMKGDMAELLIYDTGLSQADTWKVYAYLLNKYGLLPAEGKFVAFTPATNTISAAPNRIQVVHLDGAVVWESANVSLKVDGASVAATFAKDGPIATVSFVPNPLFAPQSTHTVSLSYPGLSGTKTLDWQFSVAAYTQDSVNSRVGVFLGGSTFTADGGGHSGKAGDRAADFGNLGGPIQVDGTFLNAIAQNDQMSFGFWLKKPGIEAGSAFWAKSPASSGSARGFQAHVPWSDGTLYFDTAGCCDATTERISSAITGFPGYTDATWWNKWHHFVFQKNGPLKEIWIDGQLFHSGDSTDPLPTDFTDLFIGATGPAENMISGQMDDFAVFGTALSADSIGKLAGGTLPPALPAADKLAAYWSFNDFPSSGLFASFMPTPNASAARPDIVGVVHLDGAVAWEQSNVSLKVDGAPVTAGFVKDGGKATLSYVPSPLFDAGSTHKAAVTFLTTAGGSPTTFEWQFTVGTFAAIGEDLWTAPGTGDSAKPGMKVRVWQVDQPGSQNLANRTSRAEQELAGIIAPNVANLAGATEGVFAVDLVNWNQAYASAENGNFTSKSSPSRPDTAIPGIPGTGSKPDDSIAAEVIAYVEFPTAALYTMGVLSDDGFKVTATDTPPKDYQALVIAGAASAAGSYYAVSGPSGTSKPITAPLSGKLVDMTPELGCDPASNANELKGNIALVDRGTCEFSAKIQTAKNAGALACVIVNNRDPDAAEGLYPLEMGVGAAGYQDLPAVMITKTDGEKIRTGLASGLTATIAPDATPALGEQDGGAAGADITFSFRVPVAGVYPLRLVWYEGGGDAYVEWFSITPFGEKILLNDRANPAALKCYRARTAAPQQRVALSFARQGGNITITSNPQPLPAGFVLQTAPSVRGPWTTQTGATTPITVPIGSEQAMFLRAAKP